MIVELISVGTELLLGNIVNTNAQYLSETCAKLGLNVYYQTTVGDNRERMTEVFRTALSRADLVIIGGGLGPTEDERDRSDHCISGRISLSDRIRSCYRRENLRASSFPFRVA